MIIREAGAVGMMDLQSAFGLIAGIIGFLAFIPYILETLSHKTKPNKATWTIWAVLGVIIAASYYASGARDTIWTPIAYAIGVIIVAALSFRYGEEGWSALDKGCLLGAAFGLVLWILTNEPVYTLFLTIFVDVVGYVPTIRKAYKKPESESKTAWVMFLIANALNMLAVEEWTPQIVSYPAYTLVLSFVVLLLILWPRANRNK